MVVGCRRLSEVDNLCTFKGILRGSVCPPRHKLLEGFQDIAAEAGAWSARHACPAMKDERYRAPCFSVANTLHGLQRVCSRSLMFLYTPLELGIEPHPLPNAPRETEVVSTLCHSSTSVEFQANEPKGFVLCLSARCIQAKSNSN